MPNNLLDFQHLFNSKSDSGFEPKSYFVTLWRVIYHKSVAVAIHSPPTAVKHTHLKIHTESLNKLITKVAIPLYAYITSRYTVFDNYFSIDIINLLRYCINISTSGEGLNALFVRTNP